MDWKDTLAGLNFPDPQSTEPSASCPTTPLDNPPSSRKEPQKEPRKPLLHIAFERRRGKPSTIIYGFQDDEATALADDDIAALASQLRKALGTGGSARGGEILLQGDCRQKAVDQLRGWGYKVK
ncbi:MAG: translation initiation factor [Bacteroidales bacterium]|nr:translation initiation factor [Bacteroidales bacterium]